MRSAREIHDEALRAAVEAGLPFECAEGYHIQQTPVGPLVVACSCGRRSIAPEAEIHDRLHRAMKHLGNQFTWENFNADKQPTAHARADRIRQTWEAGAYMKGPTRTGKTHLAKALVYEAIRQGKRANFIHCVYLAALFADLKSHSDPEARVHAREELATLKKNQVLAIDDLGTQTTSECFEEQFQVFLDEFQGTLLVTTNLSGQEMDKKVGRKSLRRLAERCAELEFEGRPYHEQPGLSWY